MKTIKAIVMALVFLMLVSMIGSGATAYVEENDYIIRDPIRIDGNDDFASQAADEGWPGDGNEGNPYVIEGYEIDGTDYGHGIYIGNTTVHFVVRDCYIHNVTGKDGTQEQNTGVYLYKVQNGRFEDNILYNKFGIVLWHSENNIIHNNTITAVNGIHLWYSDDNTISNNYIYYLHDGSGFSGIFLSRSEYNILVDNYISSFKYGIFVSYYGDIGINMYGNNTFVDVEYEIEEAVMVENINSTSFELIHIYITILIVSILVVIIAVILHKKRGKER